MGAGGTEKGRVCSGSGVAMRGWENKAQTDTGRPTASHSPERGGTPCPSKEGATLTLDFQRGHHSLNPSASFLPSPERNGSRTWGTWEAPMDALNASYYRYCSPQMGRLPPWQNLPMSPPCPAPLCWGSVCIPPPQPGGPPAVLPAQPPLATPFLGCRGLILLGSLI